MSTLRALPWNLKKQKTKKKKPQKWHHYTCFAAFIIVLNLYHFYDKIFCTPDEEKKMCDIMDFLDSYTFISHL